MWTYTMTTSTTYTTRDFKILYSPPHTTHTMQSKSLLAPRTLDMVTCDASLLLDTVAFLRAATNAPTAGRQHLARGARYRAPLGGEVGLGLDAITWRRPRLAAAAATHRQLQGLPHAVAHCHWLTAIAVRTPPRELQVRG